MEAGGRFCIGFTVRVVRKKISHRARMFSAVAQGVSLRGASEELLQKQVQLQEGI